MEYFKSEEFKKHREKVSNILEQIPTCENPKGWVKKGGFSVGGLEYIGFSESSDLLLVVSSRGRCVIDLEKNEKIARDYSEDFELDETFLLCEGFDILQNEKIKLAGIGGGGLPTSNKFGDSLYKASPLYPCDDIIFQPNFQHCLIEGHNKNCVRIYRGFLYNYGFSYSGNYFVITSDGGIEFWERSRS